MTTAETTETIDYLRLPHGTVIERGPATLPDELALNATAERYLYISSHADGEPCVASATKISPRGYTSGYIAGWAPGTIGVTQDSAPSVNPDVFWSEAVPPVALCIQAGHTVLTTDYQGLGRDEDHPYMDVAHRYLDSKTAARNVLDAMLAAPQLDASLSNKGVLLGYSKGGPAVIEAGQIAESYAPGLDLKGVVAYAPVSNVELMLQLLPDTDLKIYLAFIFFGLNAIDPSFEPESVMAQEALDLYYMMLQTRPWNEDAWDYFMKAFGELTAEQMLVEGEVPAHIRVRIAAYADPGRQKSSAPVLLVQATGDLEGHGDPLYTLTQMLEAQLQANGTVTTAKYYDGPDHLTITDAAKEDVRNFIAACLAHRTTPGN